VGLLGRVVGGEHVASVGILRVACTERPVAPSPDADATASTPKVATEHCKLTCAVLALKLALPEKMDATAAAAILLESCPCKPVVCMLSDT
jgi:hypothetical protein